MSTKSTNILVETLPTILNNLRIFPRAFFGVYIYVLLKTTFWYMGIDDPSTQQAALITTVYGVGTAWFGLYVGSGNGPLNKIKAETKQGDVTVEMSKDTNTVK